VPIPISRIQEALTAGENIPEGALQSISFPLLIDVVVQDNPGVTLPKSSAALAEIFPHATITPREGGVFHSASWAHMIYWTAVFFADYSYWPCWGLLYSRYAPASLYTSQLSKFLCFWALPRPILCGNFCANLFSIPFNPL